MTIHTPAFINFVNTVMDKIDYSNVGSEEKGDSIIFELDNIDDYEGTSIKVKFRLYSGMLQVEVYNDVKEASSKLVVMEDNLDFDYIVPEINSMIVDVMTETEEPEVESEPEDFNEKLDFEGIYNTEEPTPNTDEKVLPCKAYLEDDGNVMFVFDEEQNEKGYLLCFANGEHSGCDPYYPDELEALPRTDPRVKEAVANYEANYSTDGDKVKLFVVPVDTLLSVQEKTHKKIYSKD